MASIPGPPPLPLIGNLRDIDLANSIRSFCDIAAEYGPIVKLRLGRTEPVFVTGHDLANELCSRKDFVKFPAGAVRNLKAVMPEGLFTADHGEEFWEMAHRVLVPAFGPMSVRTMFPEMHDIVSQMALRWARFGEDEPIDATADFTRLTLDTIALCSMDLRFNSFYKDNLHPFVDSMVRVLIEAANRSGRPAWLTWMQWSANKKFDEDNAYLHEVALALLEKRRANPTDKKDLLNAMLKGKDPATGKMLSDETIIDNMITFLIAGHETTACLLAFLFALLLQHPEAYRKLQHEVDSVLGGEPVTAEHINQLPYVKACLREALRLNPPSAGFSLSVPGEDSSEPTLLGGKWLIQRNQPVFLLLPGLHRDRTAFGDDADEFKPERMLEENFKKLPPGSYKPFGNGLRGCIGSEFAMQEAILAVAVLFQKFDFRLKDPDYKLTWKQTLTLKPRDLFMYAKLRPGIDPLTLQRDLFHGPSDSKGSGESSFSPGTEKVTSHTDVESDLSPMSIFYGSNTGTCEGLASRLSMTALQRGFRCSMQPLDEAKNNIPKDRPVVMITSTMYEDNSEKFVEWLDEKDVSLSGVQYAIFGCGSSDWKDTYQKIAVQIDEQMEERGATTLTQRGVADVTEGNITGDFDTWMQDSLWPGVSKAFSTATVDATTESLTSLLHVPSSASDKHSDAIKAQVVEVRALTELEDRPKYHMEIKLPTGASYEVGDYLEVYPHNTKEDMDSLLQVLRIQGHDLPEPLISIMHSRLELHQPASSKQIQTLIEKCTDPEDRAALQHASAQALSPTDRRPSILQLLRHFPSIKLPLEKLALMLPPLRPRQYSISSSPLADPSSLKLTWSLITHAPPASLQDERPTRGLASHYLAGLKAGDTLECLVRHGNPRFKPEDPAAPSSAPIIMVCAGSGIAPFRAFIEHRALALEQLRPNHQQPPRALLYAGHRGPEHALYAGELEAWQATGAVDVRYAYSRGGGVAEPDEQEALAGHVQDRVWADREELCRLWEDGARVYVCGGRGVSHGVREVVRRIYREQAEKRCGAGTDADVETWWVEALRERYVVEVF
ncbi:hypothetical protein N8I77_013353 [Diaporthe amygdali]|uniref:Bifunctional cytochrome P450/NADPH--P450 reductase n=1 Tax=Phomopsis amygdali TaxID=1214568 RepID=A0AAD9S1A2_PHOAM|nr:hypothetical protein N8I77_013353 [Diaporthe amygdali]